jgi:D-alanyl-D-alanine carboxypeptidase
LRTYIITLVTFSLSVLSFQSCNTNNTSADQILEVSEKSDKPMVRTISYRPTIAVVSGNSSDPNPTISSSLSHHTSMTVGMVENQYAVVIKTNPSTTDASNAELDPVADQKFGDEIIEDEIVIETFEVPTAPIVVAESDLVVAEGPGEDPFGNDILTEKGLDEPEVVVAPISVAGGFNINNIDGAYLLGKFNPATHKAFRKIEIKYASRAGMYVRKDVYKAFLRMYKAARADGIDLKVLSATRSFSGQKRIWEAKWTGQRKVSGQDLSQAIPFGTDRAKKILEYSAMPGTSRHHWGTDLDLCALNNAFFESGKGKQIYDWLNNNARDFGFFQPYTDRNTGRETGHSEEKWHWSYIPISQPLTRKYTQILNNEKIVGFLGQESATDINILNNYVLGVNEDCK